MNQNADWHMGQKCFISYALNLAHEIHCRCFAFQCIDSKVVQNLKGKYCLRVFETSGEKPRTE